MVANSLLQETHFPAEGKREEGDQRLNTAEGEEEAVEREEEIVPPDGGAWVMKLNSFHHTKEYPSNRNLLSLIQKNMTTDALENNKNSLLHIFEGTKFLSRNIFSELPLLFQKIPGLAGDVHGVPLQRPRHGHQQRLRGHLRQAVRTAQGGGRRERGVQSGYTPVFPEKN